MRTAVPRALSGEKAWAVIFGFVFLHDATCQDKQLLSEAVDRALDKHPVLTYAFIAVTVGHLLNWLPTQLDPYAIVGHLKPKGSK